jgi:hypothetical protein
MYGFAAHDAVMETLFDKFGGIRPMAAHLSEAPSTVQSWKNAGRVPAGHQHKVLAKASELGIPITAKDVVYPLGLIGTAEPVTA